MSEVRRLTTFAYRIPGDLGVRRLELPAEWPVTRIGQFRWLAERVLAVRGVDWQIRQHEDLLERLPGSPELIEAFLDIVRSKALYRELELRLIRSGVYPGADLVTNATVEYLDDYRTDDCKQKD